MATGNDGSTWKGKASGSRSRAAGRDFNETHNHGDPPRGWSATRDEIHSLFGEKYALERECAALENEIADLRASAAEQDQEPTPAPFVIAAIAGAVLILLGFLVTGHYHAKINTTPVGQRLAGPTVIRTVTVPLSSTRGPNSSSGLPSSGPVSAAQVVARHLSAMPCYSGMRIDRLAWIPPGPNAGIIADADYSVLQHRANAYRVRPELVRLTAVDQACGTVVQDVRSRGGYAIWAGPFPNDGTALTYCDHMHFNHHFSDDCWVRPMP